MKTVKPESKTCPVCEYDDVVAYRITTPGLLDGEQCECSACGHSWGDVETEKGYPEILRDRMIEAFRRGNQTLAEELADRWHAMMSV